MNTQQFMADHEDRHDREKWLNNNVDCFQEAQICS